MNNNILLLFDRPREPVFVPKSEQKISFEVPTEYLADKYQLNAQPILNRFWEESNATIPIKPIAIPNISPALKLGRNDAFSLFIKGHREMAGFLTKLFLGMRTVEDLTSVAAYCRDRVNPQMFVYSLTVALLHRPDTKNLPVPSLAEMFPDKFFDSETFTRATEMANVVPNEARMPIEVPLDWTATDVDVEHKVAYFREDVGINLHHWHWHLVYPFEGPLQVVKKDRRGELFYYFHHQVIARYETERLCNGLARTKPLTSFRETVPEAYFSKLDQAVSGRAWPGRPENMRLSDINRKIDQVEFKISDIERWRNEIINAIKARQVRDSYGQIIPLDDFNGIDILGNIVESSILSPNRAIYGDLHNMGHMALAYSHDPDHRYLESFAVMGDSNTAMRDPIFYRWHLFIENLFSQLKDSLPAYTEQELAFPGVTVQDISILTPGGNLNTLYTHWTKSDIDLSRGLDFTPRGSVLTRIQHLNHDAFTYSFVVNNSNNRDVMGTIRVFAAPKFNDNGRPFSANDQRKLMIEMDKFTTTLTRGENVIERQSIESAITIPFEATFRNLNLGRPDSSDLEATDEFNFCGCGWPQHMLVPKGNARGFPMDLFVMVSNYEFDRINQADPTGCRTGVVFCGLRDLKYPDARSMGFPFDRKVRQRVNQMANFVLPNMKLQTITVRFNNIVKPRQTLL